MINYTVQKRSGEDKTDLVSQGESFENPSNTSFCSHRRLKKLCGKNQR